MAADAKRTKKAVCRDLKRRQDRAGIMSASEASQISLVIVVKGHSKVPGQGDQVRAKRKPTVSMVIQLS
jgi:RNase P protein component